MNPYDKTWPATEQSLTDPLHWRKPRRVRITSDLFEALPFAFIRRVFAVMNQCPQHTFQVLTKRPHRAAEIAHRLQWTPNVWMGTSVENQEAAEKRLRQLRACPAAVRFVSMEPLLGPINVTSYGDMATLDGIHWVIAGGESGPGARPCDIAWIRSIVEQCKVASVPVFVKQLGKWIAGPHDFAGWKGKIDRWMLLGDDGTTCTYHRPILRSTYSPQFFDEHPTNAIAWGLGDLKGGLMSEWPEDLRVREFPNIESEVSQ